MKRRKWRIIALSLALLAACVGVWRWSERPPFRFLKNKERIYAAVDANGLYSEYYAFTESAPVVDELIAKEIARDSYAPIADYLPMAMTPYRFNGPVILHSYEPMHDRAFSDKYADSPVPKRRAVVPRATQAIAEVTRAPTPVDRFRAWIYRFRYDGPP
jgi:hypothetical protein